MAWRRCVAKVCASIVIGLMAAVFGGAVWLRIRMAPPLPQPRYYATITTCELGRPSSVNETMMSTSFVLSLGVAASPGRPLTGSGYCLEDGTAVQVSYRGALLAGAVLERWEAVCAAWWTPPGNAWWTTVVARGNNNITTSPGFVADGLAADEQRRNRVFDVSISTADGKTAAWCGARRVGEDDKTACVVHNTSS